MAELYKTEIDGVKFKLSYKRTVKDINDNDVEIPYQVHVKTIAEIDEEIARWQSQKTNCDNQIAKLEKEKTEIAKL